jgi:Fe-S-cluster containining protein
MKKGADRRAAPKRTAPAARRVPFVGFELDARRAVRLHTAEALQNGRTPLVLIAVAADAAHLTEELTRQAMRAAPPPPSACCEGCDWCCHLTVGTTATEIVRIVQYLRQTLSPDDFAAFRERVVRLDDERRVLPAAKRDRAHLQCALLVEHRCTAYPVRPLTCRGFNSGDAAECERFVKSSGKTELPLNAAQLRVTTFALDGMSAGLSESGLNGDRLELTAALRIALEAPEAVERYLSGEPSFAAARLW